MNVFQLYWSRAPSAANTRKIEHINYTHRRLPAFYSAKYLSLSHTQARLRCQVLPSPLSSRSISLASVLYRSWQVSQSEAVQCGHLPDMFPNRPLFQGKEAALPHHGVLHPSKSNTVKCFKLPQKQQNKEQTNLKEKSKHQGCVNPDAPPKTIVSAHYLLPGSH